LLIFSQGKSSSFFLNYFLLFFCIFLWKIRTVSPNLAVMHQELNIPHRTKRVLNLVLLSFILIFIRVWYLGFVQSDYHKQQAKKPQRRTTIERVERATIRDRFNIPLAQNKIEYSAAVRYADIRELPAYKWEKKPKGGKVKKFIRGPYITSLACLLAKELDMNPKEIEDVIYAKASLFPHTPFVIKESLSEKQYYKLRMLQKDWIGIDMQRSSKRVYPLGKTACDVIGYMGSISSNEYLQIAQETAALEEYIQKRDLGEMSFIPKGYSSPLAARQRLQLLKEKSYTINDLVGKSGIEHSCDEQLRGVHGKKTVEIDPKGNVLRTLPHGKKGVSGQRVLLSISSELQEFAEALLAHHESLRDIKDAQGEPVPGTPWIKGGAIVALQPKTGEVLALASYPRFDPNDFIQSQDPFQRLEKQKSVRRWLENESHIAEIWNGKTPLKKEVFSFTAGWSEEHRFLEWDQFIHSIISPKNPILDVLLKVGSIQNAYAIQKNFETLCIELDFADPIAIIQALYPKNPHISCKKAPSSEAVQFVQNKIQTRLEDLYPLLSFLHSLFVSIPHNDDKLLLLDLTRLLMVTDHWSSSLLEKIGSISLADFFTLSQSYSQIQDLAKEKTKALYHNLSFEKWREEHFKSWLQEQRKKEKKQKTYAKPYTEYLEKWESSLFSTFWKDHKYTLLESLIQNQLKVDPLLEPYAKALQTLELPCLDKLRSNAKCLSTEELLSFLQALRSFEELDRPLYGKYSLLRHVKGVQLEKHLAAAYYPLLGFGYVRSQAFRQSTPQGSVFKLVVAYEALKERYQYLQDNLLSQDELNPLTLIDQVRLDMPNNGKQILGQMLDGQFIRKAYKGGILPRSSHAGIGKVDLVQAIEQSSNIYFSLLASEHIADPSLLEKATKDLSFGSKTGIDLQGEIAGSLPHDLSDNKTGLYAFAIGQHSLIVTPLQTAVMLAAFGNQGFVLKPQIIGLKAGKSRELDPFLTQTPHSYPFQEPLSLIGIDFPLFTESLSSSYKPYVEETEPELIRSIFYPLPIKKLLFEGMNQVICGTKGTARPSIIRYLRNNPSAKENYLSLQRQLMGKTGTAEILYKHWLDAESSASIHNHIWFGGLVFPENSNPLEEDAELAIVVYLRFSVAGGKEAAPLAAQMAQKWREIQKKYKASSYLKKEMK
jgi:cell division protein FtsI/penicillin-binding protein 2